MVGRKFSESRWSQRTRNKVDAAMGFGNQVNKRTTGPTVKFACAGGDHPVPHGDKGAECPHCKMWPLCAACLVKHQCTQGG